MEVRPRAWQRWYCHQTQSTLGPNDATDPQILPAPWNKLSLAPKKLGRREEIAERKNLLPVRGKEGAMPAQLWAPLCCVSPLMMADS